uniref:Uncharacterized protein n=1 Tax=Dictyoglomus turgidum TaxID=513050 RepID=A0A7C3SNB1_9BACT
MAIYYAITLHTEQGKSRVFVSSVKVDYDEEAVELLGSDNPEDMQIILTESEAKSVVKGLSKQLEKHRKNK